MRHIHLGEMCLQRTKGQLFVAVAFKGCRGKNFILFYAWETQKRPSATAGKEIKDHVFLERYFTQFQSFYHFIFSVQIRPDFSPILVNFQPIFPLISLHF